MSRLIVSVVDKGCILFEIMTRALAPLRQSAVVLARSTLVFRFLRHVVAGRFSPFQYRYLEPHLSGRILDIGCGTGEMAHHIRWI